MSQVRFSHSILIVVALLGFLLPLFWVQGASDDFTVKTLVGGDTTPPSIPSPFEAIPIASDQINLSWGASTDDVILSGYHVWKDGVQIATTSNLFYADTGLTPSTTYTYYVTAFDSFFNESASSTEIATSTLSIPVTPTTTPQGTTYGTKLTWLQNEIESLVVLPEQYAVIIRYKTKSYIKSVVRWGETTSYELGSSLEHAYTKFHEIKITGLTPGTHYYFTIEGQNKIAKYGELHTGDFYTLPPEDIFPPENVSNLTATYSNGDVTLSWTNPADPDFSYVRVVSNENFYPGDIDNGWAVYEGAGTGAVDKDIAQEGLWRYYTVFSYDELGNISSGAVTRVYLGEGEAPDVPEVDPTLNEIELSLSDIIFSQQGKALSVENNWSVLIDGSKQLTISIPYEILPEHLKTILVVLTDPNDDKKVFKFLLRVNKDKTLYTSTFAPLGVGGVFPLQVSIFDFKTAQIAYAEGAIVSQITNLHTAVDDGDPILVRITSMFTQAHLWLAIVLLIMLLYVSRRLMRREW